MFGTLMVCNNGVSAENEEMKPMIPNAYTAFVILTFYIERYHHNSGYYMVLYEN